jgi:hypothetical protein
VPLVDFDGRRRRVQMDGACAGCHLSATTLWGWVAGTVRLFLPDLERIELARRTRRSGHPSGSDDLTGGRQTFHLQDHHRHPGYACGTSRRRRSQPPRRRSAGGTAIRGRMTPADFGRRPRAAPDQRTNRAPVRAPGLAVSSPEPGLTTSSLPGPTRASPWHRPSCGRPCSDLRPRTCSSTSRWRPLQGTSRGRPTDPPRSTYLSR